MFFCKDCEKIVDVRPIGRKFVYTCAVCKTKNVAFGTEDAVKSFYRIAEGEPGKEEGKAAGSKNTEVGKTDVASTESTTPKGSK